MEVAVDAIVARWQQIRANSDRDAGHRRFVMQRSSKPSGGCPR
jgi:hypothetical protein